MCGITGFIDKGQQNPKGVLGVMLDTQKHRGPDNQGTWQLPEAGAYFGHNRLSIIDLSSDGNQPMIHPSGKYVLIFNGEIYNYKELKHQYLNHIEFRSSSDSEVLLHLLTEKGVSCLNELIGMFSIAFYDIDKKELLLIRDRFGVKPMFYYYEKNKIYFASEIKTLKAAGLTTEPNQKVWADYLVYGSYGLPDETFWANIHQLPGGHCLTYNAVGNFAIKKWYNFQSSIANTRVYTNEDELIEQYESVLANSVQLRFRADVPLGFNISGGLDSSVLLAMVKKLFPANKTIDAFTFYTGDSRYDELPWVEEMIKTTGYPLQKIKLSSSEIPDLASKIAHQQDEPFGGIPTIAYSKIFEAASKAGIKVLLDGQGMDEAWAGYDYYWKTSDSLVQGTNSSPVQPGVLTPEFKELARKYVYPKPFDDELKNKQYRDIFYTKIPRALRFNDRISMLYSTELREPFLDHRLVELAFAQSEVMKGSGGTTKRILRKIAQKYLGDNIALAPKRPLQTPQREWLAQDLKQWVTNNLESLDSSGWFDKNRLADIASRYNSGEYDNSFFIWQWMECSMIGGKK